MPANPEPRRDIVLHERERAVAERDARRVDGFAGVNLLELKAG